MYPSAELLTRFGTALIRELISIRDCTAAVLASPSRGKISSAVYSSQARRAYDLAMPVSALAIAADASRLEKNQWCARTKARMNRRINGSLAAAQRLSTFSDVNWKSGTSSRGSHRLGKPWSAAI